MSWDQLLEPGIVVRDSQVETDRFGYSIARLSIGPGPVDARQLLLTIEAASTDVLVVRYDAARLELASLLARSGRAVIPAGALAYWEKPVIASSLQEAEGLQVLGADTLDVDAVTELIRGIVRASFTGYGNHYSANPLLDRDAALAGYEDWAARTLHNDPGNVLVLADCGEPIGVATLEQSTDKVSFEVLLAGLVPKAQGKRLYGTLLAACERTATARGSRRIVISTQVHNVRVQRAWARHGLRPFAAIETVHLVAHELLTGLSLPLLEPSVRPQI